jgi:ketosteroid isomerase-like protein
MTREAVNRWLAAYVAAWKSYEPSEIAALFTDDATYRFHPYDEPVRGAEAVAEAWRGEGGHEGAPSRDDAGTYDGTYEAVAVDGDLAVATGSSTYSAKPGGPIEQIYDNCFVMRFGADGRCTEFTEWFMERPSV